MKAISVLSRPCLERVSFDFHFKISRQEKILGTSPRSSLVFWEKYKIWVVFNLKRLNNISSLNFVAFKNSFVCSLLSLRKDRLKKIQIKSNGVVKSLLNMANFPSNHKVSNWQKLTFLQFMRNFVHFEFWNLA